MEVNQAVRLALAGLYVARTEQLLDKASKDVGTDK
jgi:hypothetical protein